MRRLRFAGLFPVPPVGTRLWLTLAGLAIAALNQVYVAEIWPHTPAAASVWWVGAWLLWLALVPQALWWAWHWLRAYTGPVWVRLLAKAAFMSGVCVAAAAWLLVLLILVGGSDTSPV